MINKKPLSVTTNINKLHIDEQNEEKRPSQTPPKQEQLQGPYYGYTGLVNLGNTCYLNATLQCLANITDIRDFFLGRQL